MNIYSYNNEKLQRGEYDLLYDIKLITGTGTIPAIRKNSTYREKEVNARITSRHVFITGMIINRIVSGLSALILTNRANNNAGSIKLSSEFTSTPQNRIDGIKLNFVKSF